jgi:hypothetical protein
MGKRSDFERNPRDFYRTPPSAVLPLMPHLKDDAYYCEPCAGDGALVKALDDEGCTCTAAFDIQPMAHGIGVLDALEITPLHLRGADFICTNPPWDRKILHPMIERFSDLRPTWLLFDADWMHTKQSIPFLPRLRKIVSIGRVKWFDDQTGKDNAAWYLFDKPDSSLNTKFYGRI